MILQLYWFKKSSHRIFRLNNIAKVLSFLEERNVSTTREAWTHVCIMPCDWLSLHMYVCPQVKLVSIDAADVADGNSSIILGLIWNIILFFQVISFSKPCPPLLCPLSFHFPSFPLPLFLELGQKEEESSVYFTAFALSIHNSPSKCSSVGSLCNHSALQCLGPAPWGKNDLKQTVSSFWSRATVWGSIHSWAGCMAITYKIHWSLQLVTAVNRQHSSSHWES